jgi:hypothetical protein
MPVSKIAGIPILNQSMEHKRPALPRDFRFFVLCGALCAVAFPLGMLLWMIRRRARVHIAVGIVLTALTGAIPAILFHWLAVGLGVPALPWFIPLLVSNCLGLVFLSSRSPEPMRLTRARAAGYYTGFGVISLIMWALPVTVLRSGSAVAALGWTLAGCVLVWEALFWATMVLDPPVSCTGKGRAAD